MARFPTKFLGSFVGYKEPYTFVHKASGETRQAAGKLQFLVEQDGRAEILDVSESQWQQANAPGVGSIERGDEFALGGFVQLGFGAGDSYLVVQTVEVVPA